MDKILLHIILSLYTFSVLSQENLVPNGGFEDKINCPLGIADYSVKEWLSPTWGTTDYFNSCDQGLVGVPNNYVGSQNAHSGNAYSGFVTCFLTPNEEAREYLQVKLKSELESGELYEFSCFLSLSDSSKYCLNEIGIALTSNSIGGNYATNISIQPVLVDNSPNGLCDDLNWMKVSCIYFAKGGEKYLTIGVFKKDFELGHTIMEASKPLNCAYYYIDDVSIILLDDIVIPNIFTPNNDGVNDVWEMKLGSEFDVKILNRWGNLITDKSSLQNDFKWDGKTKSGEECPDGVYFYLITKDSFIKKGFIHLVR